MADLKLGASGSEVKKLQEFLLELNAKPKVKTTSKFDAPTEEALKFVQKKLKLKIDGIATPKVMEALAAAAAPDKTEAPADPGKDGKEAKPQKIAMPIRDYGPYIRRNEGIRKSNAGEFQRNLTRLDMIIRRSKDLGPDAIAKLNAQNEARAKAEAKKRAQTPQTEKGKDKGKDTKSDTITAKVKSSEDYKKMKDNYVKFDAGCNKKYVEWLKIAKQLLVEQKKFNDLVKKGDAAAAEAMVKDLKAEDAKASKIIDDWTDLVAKKVGVDKAIEETERAIKQAQADVATMS